MPHTLTTKTALDLADEALGKERSGLRAYKRSFNLALSGIPVTGALSALYPTATTMLDLVDAFASDTNTAALAVALGITEAEVIGIQRARSDITEYIRTHPDVAGLQALFGLSDTQVDNIFRAAMALDA